MSTLRGSVWHRQAELENNLQINRAQFYQAPADAMPARMLHQSEQQLMQTVRLFFLAHGALECPPPKNMVNLSWRNCVKNLELFILLHWNSNSEIIRIPKPALRVMGLKWNSSSLSANAQVDTLPVSTAACQRGSRRMNIICSPLRTALSQKYFFTDVSGHRRSGTIDIVWRYRLHMLGRGSSSSLRSVVMQQQIDMVGNAKKVKEHKVEPNQLAIWKL